MTEQTNALLHLIKAEPSLLPAAPDPCSAKQMDHRRIDEVHVCLGCGERAQCVYVASTDAGPRWLDLCRKCAAPLYDFT